MRRVYDIAVMNRAVTVDLEGSEITIKRWYQYTKMLLQKGEKLYRHKLDNEFSLYVLPADQGVQGHLAFVNGMWVPMGTHVDMIRKQLVGFLGDCYCFSDSKASSLLFFILECTVKEPQFDDGSKLLLTSGSEQVAGWVLPKPFLRKIAKSQIGTTFSPHRVGFSKEIRMRCRSVCINLDRLAMSQEDFRKDASESDIPDIAFYSIITDVPLDFDPNTAVRVQPDEFFRRVLDDIDNRELLDQHLLELYQHEVAQEMMPVYHLIGWILGTRMVFPKSDRLKSTEELNSKAFQFGIRLKTIKKIADYLGDFVTNPLELPLVTDKLKKFRLLLRKDMAKLAAQQDTKCIVYANTLISICDRLITIGSRFPHMEFSPEDLRQGLMTTCRSIAAMNGFKRYHEVLFFVDGHTNNIEEYLDDLVQLVIKVHSKLHARKVLKAETRVRSNDFACKWISLHLTDHTPPMNVPAYPSEFALIPTKIEADCVDWGEYRLPVKTIDQNVDDVN